jgi:hypothetical protein
MAVARAPTDVPALAADPRWTRPRRAPQPWTDDRSALWPIVHLRASEMFDFRAPLR